MTDSTRKIVIFLLVAVGAFVLAFGLGRVAGDSRTTDKDGHGDHGAHSDSAGNRAAYSISLESPKELPADAQTLQFKVLDADGEPVMAYDVKHEKQLHLIVVDREDPRIYRHVHPAMATDGEWAVDLDLPSGEYRMYADTSPSGGKGQVLTADFSVEGGEHPALPMADPNTTATVDGYEISLETDGPMYTFVVTQDGKPVELQPYLGAGGHLVGIRTETLDYVHAHAMNAQGGTVGFHVEVATPGIYVLHLDFQVDGKVHSATFVQRIEVDGPGGGMGEKTDEMDTEMDSEMEGHDGAH
jgi:hypothetical protein